MKIATILSATTILSSLLLCSTTSPITAFAGTSSERAQTSAGRHESNANPLVSKDIAAVSQQDLQRTMKMLGIQSLRPSPGANPDLPNSTNFDEAKAGPFSKLPDPLALDNGTKVTSAEMWWKQRRPQIVEAFDREILGRVPPNVPSVSWKVVSSTRGTIYGLPVVKKELVGHVDNSADPAVRVDIKATLTLPASAKRPAPVIMEIWMSNEEMATVVNVMKRVTGSAPDFADSMAEPMNGTYPKGYNWQRAALQNGWGYATYVATSVQPDNGASLTQGIIGLVNKGQPRTKPDDWGALRAWAWGADRILDYFEHDRSVDAKHVAIAGCSRYGKAALVTMAYDTRFAAAEIACSGEAGAKLYRRNFGEQIENIAESGEYHWMAPNFLKYAGPLTVNDLPVDANELVALCAPRPIFISSGRTRNEGKWSPLGSDGWTDAKGQFAAAVDAGRVYRLLGRKPLNTDVFPPMGTALIGSDIAFLQHTGGHQTAPLWPPFMTFLAKYFPVEK